MSTTSVQLTLLSQSDILTCPCRTDLSSPSNSLEYYTFKRLNSNNKSTMVKQIESPEYKLWLKNDKQNDPVFKSESATKVFVAACKTGTSAVSLQPAKCSYERYFPRLAEPLGLVRYIPPAGHNLPLVASSRGPLCYGGSVCHKRALAVPAFMYT